MDGWMESPDGILEGQRIQLNPDLNLDQYNLSPAAKLVAEALQKYVAFMTDNSPALSLYFENLGAGEHTRWEALNIWSITKIPLEEFRILKCPEIKVKN